MSLIIALVSDGNAGLENGLIRSALSLTIASDCDGDAVV